MFFILKSKTHVAAILIILATLIFILHYFLSSDIHEATVAKLEAPEGSMQILRASDMSDFLRQFTSTNYKLKTKFMGERLVHLDLKGAPPLVSYLKEIFPYFRKAGATGILIEYEDMFPYSGTLDNVPAYNSYNRSDIREILISAEQNNLQVIPLLQTFGHLEFILKLRDYKDLREVPIYPQVICPTHPQTLPLISTMIDQVVALHPGIKYLHLGSDEVYHIGRCERCVNMMEERRWNKEQLFLAHLRNVTNYVKMNYPHIRPIVWDDEFRNLPEELIDKFEVAKYADIMVWKYTPIVTEYISDNILYKYSRLFPGIWIASAFKGATGPDSMLPDVRHHLDNHVSWMEIVNRWKKHINFKGIALTGWQRYDHFSILCEILPAAVPSLTACLQYLEGADVDESVMSNILKCEFPFAWGPSDASNGARSGSTCEYPGFALYRLINSLYLNLQAAKGMDKDVARGWFSWYNVIHNFSNPSHVESASSMIDYHRIQLQYVEDKIKKELLQVFDNHTAQEWIETFITPALTRLTSIAEARDRLLTQDKVWPRRPLDRIAKEKDALHNICNGKGSLPCSLIGLNN